MTRHVFLVQWDAAAATDRAEELRRAGYDVAVESADGGQAFKRIKRDEPAAVVIDLSTRPSHGRAVINALADAAATRQIPVLVIGEDEPADAQPVTERLRAILPS